MGRLEEFRIKSIPVRWDNVKLTGLRLLNLQWEAPTSSAKLLSLLAASPSLESLKLTVLPGPSNSEQGNLETVNLLRLKEHTLLENEAGRIVSLLQSIMPLSLARFRMTHDSYTKGYGEDFVSALDTLSHLGPALQSVLILATNSELANSGQSIRFVAQRGTDVYFEIHFQLTKTQSLKVVKWISEVITPDSEESLICGTKVAFSRE